MVGSWSGRTSIRVAAIALVLIALAGACTPAPGAARPGEAPGLVDESLPVVLVPGWEFGCRARSDDWDQWRDAFVARGLPAEDFVVIDYDSCQPNLRTAEMVGAAVNELVARTGAPHVRLIAHSMGAISARWCVLYGTCGGKVDQLVTLSGANHGTIWAAACFLQFWGRACSDMARDSPMLAALNVDESPDGVEVETWVSPCELVILPRDSAFLDGAVNHDLVDVCVDHSGWKRYRPTIDAVADRLTAAPADRLTARS